MKPSMLFAIIMLTAIVIATSFGLHLMPYAPISVPPAAAGNALFVCPAANTTFDSIAMALQPFNKYLVIGYFFVVMLLMFSWGWALYQNLLNDKFKRGEFSNPWKLTKFTFWAGVILLVFAMTPNHFRTIKINGAPGQWVLCENTTPGARAVRASALRP